MIELPNPLLRFHKTTKGNFSGEDFQISPKVSFSDDPDSLAQIMPHKSNFSQRDSSLGHPENALGATQASEKNSGQK